MPSWLGPQAALGWGDLALHAREVSNSRANAIMETQARQSEAAMNAQARASALQQDAAQFQQQQQAAAAKFQQQQQAQATQLQEENLEAQHKIAIDEQYKKQMAAARAGELDLHNAQFDKKNQDAADRYAATAQFQQAILPKEAGGLGMNPRDAAMQYLAPYMTADTLGHVSTSGDTFQLGQPQTLPDVPGVQFVKTSPNHYTRIEMPNTATNAPPAIPVVGEDGSNLGHWVFPPGGGKAHWQPHGKTSTDDFDQQLAEYKKMKEGDGSKSVEKKDDTKGGGKTAQGGYKIGVVYKGGLKYTGGDPKDPENWEQVKK